MSFWSSKEKTEFRHHHPVTAPVVQPRHRHAHADLKSYFDLIFNSDHTEYKGLVTIAAQSSKQPMKIVGVVPADQLGIWAAQTHISTKFNYYYAKYQHTGNAKWGTENAFAYNAVYVDLDAHTKTIAKDGQDHVIDLLTAVLPDMGIPCPNIVERSGRGIHLVWLIEQVAAALGWMVQKVSEYFSKTVGKVISDYGINGYQVDSAYSSNIGGLTRIPGTYNTASRSYADYEVIHCQRVDLPKIYDSIPTVEGSNNQHRKFFGKMDGSDFSKRLGQKRMNALIKLASIRSIDSPYRDAYILHLFSAAQWAGLDNDEALSLVHGLNQSFVTPLSYRDVEGYLRTAARKHYRFTTNRIITDLCLSEEEQIAIGLVAKNRDHNQARHLRNISKKLKRDRRIMRLYMMGHSISEIVAKVGHCYNTIRSVIRKYSSNLSALFDKYALKKLLKKRIGLLIRSLHESSSFSEADFSKIDALYNYTYRGDLRFILGPSPVHIQGPALPVCNC